MRIDGLLKKNKCNDRLAISCEGKAITYHEWHDKSMLLAEEIENVVGEKSRNVIIFLPNSIEYAVAYFGIAYANKVIVPVGVQTKRAEFLNMLEYCEADLIISCLLYEEILDKILNNYSYKYFVIYVDDFKRHVVYNPTRELISKTNYDAFNQTDDDTVIMLHTSGTTSSPKRVMLTHSNLINNIESNIKTLGLTENDKVLIALPMYFGYCNTAQFLSHVYLGAPMVIMSGLFMPKQFFKIVQEEKITNFTAVPTMLLMLLQYRYHGEYDISSLRLVCFGGSYLAEEQIKNLIDSFRNISFVHTYGQTEASPRITALFCNHLLDKCKSVGKCIPNVELKIVDEMDNYVESNVVGEIVVRGKNIMKGYYKQIEATNQVLRNGWLHTGDLGFIDQDGYVYVCGRKKNMLISGGINIYPEEIEEVLMQYEVVQDVCVMSEEHPFLGEVPVAKVVIAKNADCTVKNLREYCSERLSDYKVPVRFYFVNQIEKTYNGKIKRW